MFIGGRKERLFVKLISHACTLGDKGRGQKRCNLYAGLGEREKLREKIERQDPVKVFLSVFFYVR